jgi:RNA polymerase sigma-70 factor (ECF subfamily)
MPRSLLRTDEEIADIYERRKTMLWRICFAYMKNPADTEDAVQETFYKLITAVPRFENETHEKAWLIRTASNICKNELRHWRRKTEPVEDHFDLAAEADADVSDVLKAVLDLPEKYKTAVYLYYYEGYTGPEIARMLKKPPSTVRNYLHEARILLKERLGDDYLEE